MQARQAPQGRSWLRLGGLVEEGLGSKRGDDGLTVQFRVTDHRPAGIRARSPTKASCRICFAEGQGVVVTRPC